MASYRAVQLDGTRGVPTAVYSGDDIMKIIHLQACARRFLAKRLMKNVLENPSQFLKTTGDAATSYYSRYTGTVNYQSQLVDDKLQ